MPCRNLKHYELAQSEQPVPAIRTYYDLAIPQACVEISTHINVAVTELFSEPGYPATSMQGVFVFSQTNLVLLELQRLSMGINYSCMKLGLWLRKLSATYGEENITTATIPERVAWFISRHAKSIRGFKDW